MGGRARTSAGVHAKRWLLIGAVLLVLLSVVFLVMRLVSWRQEQEKAKLLALVDKEAARIDRIVDVLLQLHVAQEETKSGFTVDELLEAATAGQLQGFEHVRLRGVMGMASLTDDQEQVRREFARIKSTFETLRSGVLAGCECFTEVSMGMSDDWPLAVEEGSTMVRIGTDIFGPREY